MYILKQYKPFYFIFSDFISIVWYSLHGYPVVAVGCFLTDVNAGFSSHLLYQQATVTILVPTAYSTCDHINRLNFLEGNSLAIMLFFPTVPAWCSFLSLSLDFLGSAKHSVCQDGCGPQRTRQSCSVGKHKCRTRRGEPGDSV